MINNSVIAPQMAYSNPCQALPDDSDRVSSVVGYDVNNYVWGSGQAQPNSFNTQNTMYQNPIPNRRMGSAKTPLLGGAILTGLVMGSELIFNKLTGKGFSAGDIKKAFVELFTLP